MKLEYQLKKRLSELGLSNIEIRFSKKAADDLFQFDKQTQEVILALLIKRATRGPLLKPKGIAEPLRAPLHNFSKIKPKSMGIRIIYRPTENGVIKMDVIAIGPKDKEKVYKMAAKRLPAFLEEMKYKKPNGSFEKCGKD
jgi:mRNA interferase RelE/StbE